MKKNKDCYGCRYCRTENMRKNKCEVLGAEVWAKKERCPKKDKACKYCRYKESCKYAEGGETCGKYEVDLKYCATCRYYREPYGMAVKCELLGRLIEDKERECPLPCCIACKHYESCRQVGEACESYEQGRGKRRN